MKHWHLVAALCFMCSLRASAQEAQAFDLCSTFARYTHGETVEFDHQAYTFMNMPDDLVPVVDLFLNDPAQDNNGDGLVNGADASMYAELYSPSQNALWIFAFRTLTVSTDSAGQHQGLHDFCMPVRVIYLSEYPRTGGN